MLQSHRTYNLCPLSDRVKGRVVETNCAEVAMRKKMKDNDVQHVEELQTCVKRH